MLAFSCGSWREIFFLRIDYRRTLFKLFVFLLGKLGSFTVYYLVSLFLVTKWLIRYIFMDIGIFTCSTLPCRWCLLSSLNPSFIRSLHISRKTLFSPNLYLINTLLQRSLLSTKLISNWIAIPINRIRFVPVFGASNRQFSSISSIILI